MTGTITLYDANGMVIKERGYFSVSARRGIIRDWITGQKRASYYHITPTVKLYKPHRKKEKPDIPKMKIKRAKPTYDNIPIYDYDKIVTK